MNSKALLALSLLFLTILSCQGDPEKAALERAESQIDSLRIALDSEKARADSIIRKVNAESEEAYPLFFGKNYDEIENPEEFIKKELASRPELIPLKPVLGGSMQFRKIEILTEEWLLAIYEDGHIQGKAIMAYTLKPNGELEFEVVVAQK